MWLIHLWKFCTLFFIQLGNDIKRIKAACSQTKLRGSINIIITDQDECKFNNEHYDEFIKIDNNTWCGPILSIIILQIIAYCLAIEKNIDPDKPRNLAKTVTVI